MAWFAQPFFKSVDVPLAWYGTLWAILNLSAGITSLNAWRIERRLGPPGTVLLFTVTLIAAYLLLSGIPYTAGIIVLFVFYLARGIATPTLRNYINVITTTDVRATVLSVRNFLIRLIFSLVGPLLGYLMDIHGISVALLSAGIFYGIAAGVSMVFFIKYRTFATERS
jgi:hypothetical protein